MAISELTTEQVDTRRRSWDSFDTSSPSSLTLASCSTPPSPMIHTPTDSMFSEDPHLQKRLSERSVSFMTPCPSLELPPPPDYLDCLLQQRRMQKCQSLVLPREEEGNEVLPPYECTVYKMGYLLAKCEMEGPGRMSHRRSWRKYYIEVWGTILRIYSSDPNQKGSRLMWQKQKNGPLKEFSLAGAEAKRAIDYNKRPHVLRLSLMDGPQMLLRLPSKVEMISWIEHLQAAINISLDLEYRQMPRFVTLYHRRLAADTLAPRAVQLELARERRRMAQQEALI
ncbi:hypothetical protein BX666DRAFT_1980349 [Dichotomocladium elegans]|nr:hypothetical protein BX666DRAFT_1980349 [Dichotomocladium elegans]